MQTDEVAGLKENAETWAALDASVTAELVTTKWKTEGGEDQVLKILTFMDKEAFNTILAEIARTDKPLVQEILDKRIKVSRQSESSSPSGK